MGQHDILAFLRKQGPQWFSANQISQTLNVSAGSVLACLRRLRKANLVDFKNHLTKVGTVYKNVFIYKFKGAGKRKE